MFKKPKRNFRSRKTGQDGSDTENNDNGEEKMVVAGETYIVQEETDGAEIESEIPTVSKKKKKKKDKEKISKDRALDSVPRNSSVLSFGDDIEEETSEVFKIKRSSHSKRAAKQLKKQTQAERDKELEMKKKKKEMQKMKQQTQSNGPAAAPTSGSVNNDKGEDMELDSDFDPDEDLVPNGDADKEEEKERENDRRRAFNSILECGIIPDAKMIHEARKRRQIARESGDYIPIDDTVKIKEDGSRLIREDDNDKSDSDTEPVSFSVNNRENELRKIQTTILAAQEDSDNEQEKEWIEQQIRKGVSIPSQQDEATAANNRALEYYESYQPRQQQQYAYSSSHSIFNPTGPQYTVDSFSTNSTGAQPLPPTNLGFRQGLKPTGNLPDITLELLMKRLTERLATMTSVHRTHVFDRDDMKSRMEACETNIENYEGSKNKMEEQYKFFQEMRGYVRDLVECLNEKVPEINFLDRRMDQIEKARTDRIAKRRQEDVKDQSGDFSSMKAAAAPKLTGMDLSKEEHIKQRRVAEREARRSRRRRKREISEVKDHYEGMSTDDEENNSIIAKYNTELDTIKKSSRTMFDEVMEDFHNVNIIRERFDEWRNQQTESYDEAYIGMCLPKLFSPFIKLSLVTWNPVKEKCPKIENLPWFESLMVYSFRSNKNELLKDDPDLKLVPSLIERVVIPKITTCIEDIWEPLAGKETRQLVSTIQRFICDYPTISADSKNVKAMIKATVTRIRKTLDNDVFIPIYTPDILQNKASGQYQFFQRQFWTCVKLLGNILCWHGILSDRVLRELALDGLLNRYVMLGLMNSPANMETIKKCSAICTSFPSAWFSDLDDHHTIPQLENLCRYLVTLADRFEKSQSQLNKKENRDCIKQIVKLLVNIHALNHATSISKL